MIIITGGAGFIGANVIWELNRNGIDNILVVDNLAKTEKWKNLSRLRFDDYIHRDVLPYKIKFPGFMKDVSTVIHLGACSSTTEKDADFLMRNNYHYSVDLCKAALSSGCRFICASSAATYGNGENGFSDSLALLPKLRPLNMYGYSKHLFDLWCMRNNVLDKVVNLKFFNVFGPDEYHKSSMMSMVCRGTEQIRTTGRIKLFRSHNPLYKDGESCRDFIYSKDCATLIRWFMENPGYNGIYNAGSGKARTWNDLANAIFAAMNKKSEIEYIEMPEDLQGKYQYFTEADMSWLKRLNCLVKFHSLEDGVTDYVRNYLLKDDPYLTS